MVRRRLALLAGAVVAGVVLRVWRIGSKPLWLDEVVTALVCLGRGPESVPVGVAFDLARLPELFSVDTAATWRDLIALLGHPGLQHTHPPIFYILSHQWLAWAQPSLADLASTLRLVAALFGVLAIVAKYAAAREAYDDNAGLVAAALTAVSPYTVMLGQEARNYTLPLLLTTCSLWAALAIVRRLHDGGPRAGWWALWVVTAVLGLYSHYYAAFACAAQIPVLALAGVRARARSDIVAILGAMAVTAIAFLP